MKSIILHTATCLIALTFITPVRAENPQHLQQLLQTNLCRGCDLSGADLQGAHLIGADLRGSRFIRI